MAGEHNDNRKWPGDEEDHSSLADAHTRINEARSAMENLDAEVRNFVRQTVQMMVRGWSRERNSFVGSLPPARLSHKGKVNRRIRLLCGKVTENLRAALDYGIMKVAQETKSDLTAKEKREVKFIIARTPEHFEREAKRALRYVREDMQHWMEQLQPYHGNQILEFVAHASSQSKHHSLPKVQHATDLTIILREDAEHRRTWEENGWWIFPAGKGQAFFTRAGQSRLVIRKRHDALTVFPICIEHVQRIINTLEYYLQNGDLPRDDRIL